MRSRFMRIVAFVLAVLPLGVAAGAQEARGLKIYISVDMEGIGGVVSGDQTGPQGWEYQQARKWMTAEANAAIQAAFEAGAREVLVSDSHGNAQSLLLDELDPRARLIRGWPRKLIMMEGIDSSFDAALFIGYHASEGMRNAVLAHTMRGVKIIDIKLNGKKVPEAGFNAAVAGHFGVPVVLVSGDQTVIAETRALLGELEGAEVKTGSGTVAKMMHPEKAQALIREKTRAALARLGDIRPWRLETPVKMEIIFKEERDAEVAGYLPGARMLDGRTVEFSCADMVEASGILAVITGL